MELNPEGKHEQQSFEKFIPLDKSWIIRMGVMDLIHGYTDIQKFLSKQKNLNSDLLALKHVTKLWNTDIPFIDVGESGTLYRLLQFASWKLHLNKQFIKRGTLKDRSITNDPSIVNLSLEELLKLDNETSQWATASVLLGNRERIANPPFKLQQTFDAVDHWNKQRAAGLAWEPKHDETIKNQAETFITLLKGKQAKFNPKHSEDYCFARVFEYITKEEGEKRWPSLRGHETDRIEEMEKAIAQAKVGKPVDSKDHRVVQTIAMWGAVNKKKIKFTHPEAVNKSWPKFWEFLAEATK